MKAAVGLIGVLILVCVYLYYRVHFLGHALAENKQRSGRQFGGRGAAKQGAKHMMGSTMSPSPSLSPSPTASQSPAATGINQ
jgi:hypothetical protein